ncbi:hypothetical protein Tco_0053627 [Tanacetum coccineum]
MAERPNLDEDKGGKLIDPTRFRGMVGSLMYLSASRPDIVFAVCMCARYQAKPTEMHLTAIKRIFRYLKGTIHMDSTEKYFLGSAQLSWTSIFFFLELAGLFQKAEKYPAISTTEAGIHRPIRIDCCSNLSGCSLNCETMDLRSQNSDKALRNTTPLLGVNKVSPEDPERTSRRVYLQSKGRTVADSIAARLTRPTVYKFKTDCCVFIPFLVILWNAEERDVVPPGLQEHTTEKPDRQDPNAQEMKAWKSADDELQLKKIIRFRLGGRAHSLTLLEFAHRLGLYQAIELEEDGFNVYFEGGLRSDDNFNATDYWLSISREENLGLSRSHTSIIKNLILRVIHKMITYGLCQRTTGYDKVQKNDLWLLSMFDARHQNGYANVAWVIAKWMKRKGAGTQKES